MAELISIITVNYNNAKGLQRTLESVNFQTCKNFEHIIIDGASSDNSLEIISQCADETINRRYVSEPDLGIYNAMNKGIKISKGDYCLFLNSGDILANDRVVEDVYLNDLDCDIVAGNSVELLENNSENLVIPPDVIFASFLILNYLPHQATFIRRDLFEKIHGYDESFKVVSDWLFFIESILVHHATYRHLNLFVACCDNEGISSNPDNCKLMESEFNRGLKITMPLFYNDYLELRSFRKLQNNKFSKLENPLFIKCFSKSRTLLLRVGYFRVKKRVKELLFFRKILYEDKLRKQKVEKQIYKLPYNCLINNNSHNDIIVSLTSYGKRTFDSVPYAIFSLFQQTTLPNRIVLYLDKENWNEQNIPSLLKRLKLSGLEIRFCKDIRSFKKLIPALSDFPNNPIITVDDDFYYNSHLIEWLVKSYNKSDKKTIFGSWACIPERQKGKFIPYSKWRDCKYGNNASEYSLFAGNGTLYPPHIFDGEIKKEDIFMRLCPLADDIWFWIQEERLNIKRKLIDPCGVELNSSINRIDVFDYKRKNTLFSQNVLGNKNDKQFKDLLEYYHL